MFESIHQAHFQDFKIQATAAKSLIEDEDSIHLCIVKGVPQRYAKALDAMTTILSQFPGQSIYQMLALPGKPRRVGRYIAKQRLKSALDKAQKQDTRQGILGQETKQRVDVDSLLDSPDLQKQYERLSSALVYNCQVTLAFWDHEDAESNLRAAVNVLIGSISSPKKKTRLRTKYISGSLAKTLLERTLELKRKRMTTEMTTEEAVPFFELPHIEVGIQTTTQASFSSAKTFKFAKSCNQDGFFMEGLVVLGYLYRYSMLDEHHIKHLSLEDLRKHTVILGKTGSGKTTTKNRLVIGAWQNGISSLILDPAKAESWMLKEAIPELRVFTLGKETVTPYRLNPFHIAERVSIQLHLNLLFTCFVAGWPVYGILANHVRRVITQTYVNNGWDPLNEVQGRTITLDMFRDEVERFCEQRLVYGGELTQDFRGALLARAEDLCDPFRAAIFNTVADLSMEELLSVPTVIELSHLGDPEFVAFVTSLLLVRVYEYFHSLGPSGKLRHLLVIDEAHRVLEDLPKTLDMSEGAVSRRLAIDQLVNLISEARSLGLGVVLAEQHPTRLARDAIKNCHNLIVHKLTSPEDLQLMALETGCNKEQAEHISYLKVGEAVVRGASDTAPYDVQVIHDPDHFPEMKRVWTEDDVREMMHPFYKAHPDLAKTPEIPVLLPNQSRVGTPLDTEVTLAIQIEDIVRNATFEEMYCDALTEDANNLESSELEGIIAHFAVSLAHLPGTPVQKAEVLLEMAADIYGPPSQQPNHTLIKRLIAESLSKPDSVRRGDITP